MSKGTSNDGNHYNRYSQSCPEDMSYTDLKHKMLMEHVTDEDIFNFADAWGVELRFENEKGWAFCWKDGKDHVHFHHGMTVRSAIREGILKYRSIAGRPD